MSIHKTALPVLWDVFACSVRHHTVKNVLEIFNSLFKRNISGTKVLKKVGIRLNNKKKLAGIDKNVLQS